MTAEPVKRVRKKAPAKAKAPPKQQPETWEQTWDKLEKRILRLLLAIICIVAIAVQFLFAKQKDVNVIVGATTLLGALTIISLPTKEQ